MSLMVKVTTQAANVVNGSYDVEFADDRLFLRRPGDADAGTILVGSDAKCDSWGTIRVDYQGSELAMMLPWLQLNRRNQALDLAEFISGKRDPSRINNAQQITGDTFPIFLGACALLPLLIPVIAKGNVVPSVIGIVLSLVCLKSPETRLCVENSA